MKHLVRRIKDLIILRLAAGNLIICFLFSAAYSYGQSAASSDSSLFYDSHFHLTNYIQEGITIHNFLNVMGSKVGRSTLFGIPLQQEWSYENSGDFAPTYYLASDAPLYYYSFTDAYIAMSYKSLTPQEQKR